MLYQLSRTAGTGSAELFWLKDGSESRERIRREPIFPCCLGIALSPARRGEVDQNALARAALAKHAARARRVRDLAPQVFWAANHVHMQ